MKKRYLYALLFGVPGFFMAGILSLFVFGVSLGFLWIYVFGDSTWPAAIETALSVSLVLVFLIAWTAFLTLGYWMGKRLEGNPGLNKTHILLSAGLTLIFLLFILIQQLSVGNIGPKSDTVLCSNYCSEKGYAGSGMPPRDSGDRTCSCYDASGKEALTIPLGSIPK